MKNLTEKALSLLAGVVVVSAGVALASLGFGVMVFLVMVALAAFAVALITSPFVAFVVKRSDASVVDAAEEPQSPNA